MTRIIRVILFAVGAVLPLLSASGGPEPEDEKPHDLVTWKIVHFSADELSDGTADDRMTLSDDGIPNLIRYAMGYGPREPMPDLIRIASIDDQVVVTHPAAEPLPDVACYFETSSDLVRWESMDEPGSGLSDAPARISMAGPRFFRLRAERLIEDIDADGLSDDQELAWFASINHGPSDDPDKDGLSTAQELNVGRSPHRAVLQDMVEATRATGLEVFTPLE